MIQLPSLALGFCCSLKMKRALADATEQMSSKKSKAAAELEHLNEQEQQDLLELERNRSSSNPCDDEELCSEHLNITPDAADVSASNIDAPEQANGQAKTSNHGDLLELNSDVSAHDSDKSDESDESVDSSADSCLSHSVDYSSSSSDVSYTESSEEGGESKLTPLLFEKGYERSIMYVQQLHQMIHFLDNLSLDAFVVVNDATDSQHPIIRKIKTCETSQKEIDKLLTTCEPGYLGAVFEHEHSKIASSSDLISLWVDAWLDTDLSLHVHNSGYQLFVMNMARVRYLNSFMQSQHRQSYVLVKVNHVASDVHMLRVPTKRISNGMMQQLVKFCTTQAWKTQSSAFDFFSALDQQYRVDNDHLISIWVDAYFQTKY